MPTTPDQLYEQYPERVGALLKRYGITVVSCDNPKVDANSSIRRMQRSSSNSADTVAAIEAWAEQAVQIHLAYHQKMGTTPCRPIIESTSAIYQSPDGVGVIWVPLDVLEGALTLI